MHEGIKPQPPKFREMQQREAQAVFEKAEAAGRGESQDALPTRPNRKPFGSMQLKLAYDIRKGFHGHWFNDIPGRIDRAKDAGYEHVVGKDGKNVGRVVGTAEGGGALTAFLMEIPQEWYDEDMKVEQAFIDEKEELMRRGKFEKPEQGYVPQQGITIRKGT